MMQTLMRVPALILLLWTAVAAHAAIQAVIDTDEVRTTPVPHRYIHGVILDDAKFQILLPVAWNGKVVIHTRGFSGTEFSTGAFLPAALAKGYAFAASDEGWNRVTIKDEPEDTYYESRQRLVELTLYMNATVKATLRQGILAHADHGRFQRRSPHQVDAGGFPGSLRRRHRGLRLQLASQPMGLHRDGDPQL